MNMKQHILAGLREQIDLWEKLLAGLSEAQMLTPLTPSHWLIKDVIAHLYVWQKRSIARVEAAVNHHEPNFPHWLENVDPDTEEVTDQVNAWIYETYRNQPWSQLHQDWRAGYEQLIQLADQISERDLLDSGHYPWLQGYPLIWILIATYDHHQEHYDNLNSWLLENS